MSKRRGSDEHEIMCTGVMPRGDNFRGKPGPGRRKGVRNKITAEVRDVARRLVEDRAYRANLRQRLLRGEAGALEILIWRFAFGEPSATSTVELHERRLDAIREAARERLSRMDPVGLGVFTALSMGVSLEQALRSAGIRSRQ